jgi:Glutathione-dependent formaldehyde-activating enzyme
VTDWSRSQRAWRSERGVRVTGHSVLPGSRSCLAGWLILGGPSDAAPCDDDRMTTRTAECACGRVRVSVENEPLRVLTCHCDFCQKRTGSVFQVSARFAEDQVVEISGETKIYNGLQIDGVGVAGSGVGIS